jgi:hypothetical protein
MSLKALHFFLIVISILLAFAFAAWNVMNYRSPGGVRADLIWGIGSAVVGLGLIGYEFFFLRKLKNVSFL